MPLNDIEINVVKQSEINSNVASYRSKLNDAWHEHTKAEQEKEVRNRLTIAMAGWDRSNPRPARPIPPAGSRPHARFNGRTGFTDYSADYYEKIKPWEQYDRNFSEYDNYSDRRKSEEYRKKSSLTSEVKAEYNKKFDKVWDAPGNLKEHFKEQITKVADAIAPKILVRHPWLDLILFKDCLNTAIDVYIFDFNLSVLKSSVDINYLNEHRPKVTIPASTIKEYAVKRAINIYPLSKSLDQFKIPSLELPGCKTNAKEKLLLGSGISRIDAYRLLCNTYSDSDVEKSKTSSVEKLFGFPIRPTSCTKYAPVHHSELGHIFEETSISLRDLASTCTSAIGGAVTCKEKDRLEIVLVNIGEEESPAWVCVNKEPSGSWVCYLPESLSIDTTKEKLRGFNKIGSIRYQTVDCATNTWQNSYGIAEEQVWQYVLFGRVLPFCHKVRIGQTTVSGEYCSNAVNSYRRDVSLDRLVEEVSVRVYPESEIAENAKQALIHGSPYYNIKTNAGIFSAKRTYKFQSVFDESYTHIEY